MLTVEHTYAGSDNQRDTMTPIDTTTLQNQRFRTRRARHPREIPPQEPE